MTGAGRRRLFGLLAAFCCVLMAGGPALADRGFDRRGDDRGAGRFAFPDDRRGMAERDALREERRQRRLSEEQRQQLRRDIDEAGRDIYRRPRRFRD